MRNEKAASKRTQNQPTQERTQNQPTQERTQNQTCLNYAERQGGKQQLNLFELC